MIYALIKHYDQVVSVADPITPLQGRVLQPQILAIQLELITLLLIDLCISSHFQPYVSHEVITGQLLPIYLPYPAFV